MDIRQDSRGIIKPTSEVAAILSNPAIVVERQIEMMSVLAGFEQATRFNIMDANGNVLAYLVEDEGGISAAVKR